MGRTKTKLFLIIVSISISLTIIIIIQERERERERELRIRKYGRFGNNIKQITNAIKLGLQTGCTKITFKDKSIILPVSDDLDRKNRNYSFITKMNKSGANYFYIEKLKEIYPRYDDTLVNEQQVRDILLEYCFDKYKFIHSSYLCIHIRSCDLFPIFLKSHSSYVQPPYDFYNIRVARVQATTCYFDNRG